jgi:hypothetical protein
MRIKSSKSRTGFCTVLQHDHDLDPSWNTYMIKRWANLADVHTEATHRCTWVVHTALFRVFGFVVILAASLVCTSWHGRSLMNV